MSGLLQGMHGGDGRRLGFGWLSDRAGAVMGWLDRGRGAGLVGVWGRTCSRAHMLACSRSLGGLVESGRLRGSDWSCLALPCLLDRYVTITKSKEVWRTVRLLLVYRVACGARGQSPHRIVQRARAMCAGSLALAVALHAARLRSTAGIPAGVVLRSAREPSAEPRDPRPRPRVPCAVGARWRCARWPVARGACPLFRLQ